MKQPNIIMILTDEHNGKVVHSNGDPWVRTPNMDRLAENGVLMEHAYCNSPLCVPSRCSMLTGLMPHTGGIFNNAQCLPSDRATFVHCLGAAGYETVLSGRMHFVGPDQRHGYEKRLVGDITTAVLGVSFAEKRYGYFSKCAMPGRSGIERSGKGECSVMAYDLDVTDAAVEFLKTREEDRPLFLTVGLYGPHSPYVAPEELFDYYYSVLPEPEVMKEEQLDSMHPFERKFLENRGLGHETAEEIRRVRAAYYGMVEYEDRLLGRIMDAAEQTLGLENTVILYTSDHGDGIGYHGLFWKSNMREESLRIPMIFSWKDKIPAGRRFRGLSCLLDLSRTFTDFASAPDLPGAEGISLKPYLLSGKDLPYDRPVISEICDIKGEDPAAMIRKGRYKYISYYGYENGSLYDLEQDPDENFNLGQDETYSRIKEELKSELEQVWDGEGVYRQREAFLPHMMLMRKWAKKQNVNLLYDEWKQEGERRNQNYLIVDGKKIFE
ncbi:MAG: sulfatase-like hydrolase/transferase [Clostridiaceae bacterium]|nr:sulfatase-like hydrolase/transferase [Clostridiaceae bacterium]